jgi:hypothetical protein
MSVHLTLALLVPRWSVPILFPLNDESSTKLQKTCFHFLVQNDKKDDFQKSNVQYSRKKERESVLLDRLRDLKIRQVQVRPVVEIALPMRPVRVIEDVVGVAVVHDAFVVPVDVISYLPGRPAEMVVAAGRMAMANAHGMAHLMHGR